MMTTRDEFRNQMIAKLEEIVSKIKSGDIEIFNVEEKSEHNFETYFSGKTTVTNISKKLLLEYLDYTR